MNHEKPTTYVWSKIKKTIIILHLHLKIVNFHSGKNHSMLDRMAVPPYI